MTYGWKTTKAANGFEWNLYKIEWSEELQHGVTTVLKAGISKTRAQASGIAKKWVLYARKGGEV